MFGYLRSTALGVYVFQLSFKINRFDIFIEK